jgi:hypothetical protein
MHHPSPNTDKRVTTAAKDIAGQEELARTVKIKFFSAVFQNKAF